MVHRRGVEKPGRMGVLAKADAVVDLLVRSGPLTPAEIAEGLGEPRSSIYRLLSSLEDLGWVERDSRPHAFCLGLKLIAIGEATAGHLDVRRVALPVMQQLHRTTGESIFLCLRREWRAVCVEHIEGIGLQSRLLQIGGSLPLHAGAAGLALLAFEPVDAWHGYVAMGPLRAYTASTPVDAPSLFRLLAETRRSGVAISNGGATPGIAGMGAPVMDHTGAVVAALSISGLSDRLLAPRLGLAAVVTKAGAEISAGLGFAAARATAS